MRDQNSPKKIKERYYGNSNILISYNNNTKKINCYLSPIFVVFLGIFTTLSICYIIKIYK